RQEFSLPIECGSHFAHYRSNGRIRLCRNTGEFSIILNQLKQGFTTNNLLATSIWPNHLISCLFSVRCKAMYAKVLSMAIGYRINETITINHIRVDWFSVEPLEARGHQQSSRCI